MSIKILSILIITISIAFTAYYGEIASLEHETTLGFDNSIVQIDSDTYALAHGGTDSDGYITTFTISSDGSTITEVASLEHNTMLDRAR